jgi:hypothetical protein
MNNSTPYNFTRLNLLDYANNNCSKVMEIWSYLQYNETREDKYGVAYHTYGTVYQSVVQGFEAIKNGSLETPTMNQDFWDWVVNSSSLWHDVEFTAFNNCPKEMCEIIGWEGSPDLAGIGVSTTFGILTSRLKCANLNRCWPRT